MTKEPSQLFFVITVKGNIKKEQNEIKEYNKELKELYAMKDEIEKVNNKLNSFFLNDSPTSNEVEEEYDNYES